MKIINKYFTKALFLFVIFGLSGNSYSDANKDSAADNLPLPSVLFARNIEAIGGKQLLLAHTMQATSGKLLIKAFGVEGNIQQTSVAPNKTAIMVDLGKLGTSRSGFNGTVGWSMDVMSGNNVLKGEALQAMITNADIYANNLHLGKGAAEQRTINTVTFDKGEQYKVFLVDAKGEESFLYFSKETGLLSGMDKMTLGPMGKMPTKIRLSNYVEFDGLKTARTISSSQNNVETLMEIDSVSYEKPASNVFDLPSEIQALISK